MACPRKKNLTFYVCPTKVFFDHSKWKIRKKANEVTKLSLFL